MILQHTSILKKTLTSFLIVTLVLQFSFLNSDSVFAEEGNENEVTASQSTNETNSSIYVTTDVEDVMPEPLQENAIPEDETVEIIEETIAPSGSSTIVVPALFSTFGTSTASLIAEFGTSTTMQQNEEALEQSFLPVGTTTIVTGDVIAMANILNIVNTNLVNSTGSIVMVNHIEGFEGNLDFRNTETVHEQGCSLLTCNGIDALKVSIDASASIDNVIVLDATSGTNRIATVENGIISTGNTIAGLNLINIANTNLIDSNYLLLTLNAFSNITGDIILPSLTNFFGTQQRAIELGEISSASTGNIENNLDVQATTGNNESNHHNHGSINSGMSLSSTNIYNNINSNSIGGNTVSIFLKIHGSWIGELFGAPVGTEFVQDGNMRVFHFENQGTSHTLTSPTYQITSTTTADIHNDVRLLSDSGNNKIADVDSSIIETGNALASANIVNIANTNIVGKNWVLAIINIFGDYVGNISFGKADMWIGEQVRGESYIDNGTELTYTLTLINKGDSVATEVSVISKYATEYIDIISSNIFYSEIESGSLTFDVGTVAPGEAREITFVGRIKNTVPGTNIVNSSTVSAHEPENLLSNNSDGTTITTTYTSIGGTALPPTVLPQVMPLTVTNQTTRETGIILTREIKTMELVGAGTVGEQVLKIINPSNSILPSVTVSDILYDKDGNVVKTEIWELGNIMPNEEITLSYSISFGNQAPFGVYLLTTELAYGNGRKVVFENNGQILYKQDPVTFISQESVLGASIATIESKAVIKTATKKEGVILGAFIELVGPETAYAGEFEEALTESSVSQIMGYLLQQLLLIIAACYIYRQQRRTVVR